MFNTDSNLSTYSVNLGSLSRRKTTETHSIKSWFVELNTCVCVCLFSMTKYLQVSFPCVYSHNTAYTRTQRIFFCYFFLTFNHISLVLATFAAQQCEELMLWNFSSYSKKKAREIFTAENPVVCIQWLQLWGAGVHVCVAIAYVCICIERLLMCDAYAIPI